MPADLTAADAARLLAESCCPGPWVASGGSVIYAASGWVARASDAGTPADMRLIAAAPDLARAVIRLEAERDEARRVLRLAWEDISRHGLPAQNAEQFDRLVASALGSAVPVPRIPRYVPRCAVCGDSASDQHQHVMPRGRLVMCAACMDYVVRVAGPPACAAPVVDRAGRKYLCLLPVDHDGDHATALGAP